MSKTYLEITLHVADQNRGHAGQVYLKYQQPFLRTVPGAQSKELLLRKEDVQVLHGFQARTDAENYLRSDLFNNDVVKALSPYLAAAPEIRIYECV
jgi:hypothetical protein